MDQDPGSTGTPSSSGNGDKDDSVPITHGLQLLAKLASPTVVSQTAVASTSTNAPITVASAGAATGSVSPRGQNKVTIGVQQVSNMLQGKTIKQGAQTFYITTPATSGNLVGKPIQLQTSSAGKPYLIQTSGGLVSALQAGQSGQRVILTSKGVQQPSSNVGTSILSTVPTTSTVQAAGKPIMVSQQNQPQIKFVTKTSPNQQPKTSQPMKVQLRLKDSTVLQKLQQSGQVMTLGGQGKVGDGKQQPIRLVLPGSSAGSTNTGQIQLIQTQQGLHKVITVQQPQQQAQPQPPRTVQIAQPQNKSPVQFAVVQQPGAGGTGTRLVVVSQPSSSTSTTTTVPGSPAGKSSLLSNPGTIRIVLPPQSQVGDASKTADAKAPTTVSAQNIYQILANQKVQIPRASNVGTLNQGQVKLIQSSGGSTVRTSRGQTCIIVPSSVSSTVGKSIAIASSPKSPGSSSEPLINRISPIRQGNTVVHIVSGAGGQQIATVLNTTANTVNTMQPKPGVQTVRITSPTKTVSLSPRGQGKPVSGAGVKLFTTITTTAAGSIKQLTSAGHTVTSKVISMAPTVTTQSLSTVSTSNPQKITLNKKVISFASVLPKTGVASEKTNTTTIVTTVPGVASTSGAGTSTHQQKLVKILPTKPGQKPTQLVILVNQTAANIGEEVKEIGEELNKLQNQPKTQETVDKLKQLQARLQKLQVAAQLSAKAKNQELDEPLPTNEKERKKIIKQRKLQEKANRIIAEAVAKARAAGKIDIPKVLLDNDEISAELISELELEAETKKKKKDKKDRSKSKKSSKQSKEKRIKDKKLFTIKKKPSHSSSSIRKLPAAAFLKLKRQKRQHGEFSGDSSDLDETPPPSPPPDDLSGPGIEKRRSGRNTNRKRYTEDYDFNITSNDDSSSDDEKEKEKKKKVQSEPKVPAAPKPIKLKVKTDKQEEDVDVEGISEIDVLSFEPSETAKFFVDNPDESQANVIEKILASRITKKPQIPGEAQVGEIEEYFVKYRNFSYLHCEWATIEKLSADPRIFQKIKRFRLKQQANYGLVSEFDEGEYFNPDFIRVDRILDKAITKDEDSDDMVTHYLVKWASLAYEDATWELAEDVDKDKAKIYEKFSKMPSKSERQRKPRPGKSEWNKLSKTPKYKDENVLREYQLEGVNWLTFSWCNGQSCILADEMGLGKTIQTIGFLHEVEKTGIKGPFLVLAPLSTITNWQREVESWTDMNCVVYHGGSQSRHMIAEYEMFFKDAAGIRIPNIYKFQILITTYEILLADCQELSEIEWRVLVIDEAHRLKNRNCKLLEGLKILDMEHRVLLTGTPLQNNVDELFSLLNFLEPGRFRSSSQFLEDFGDLKTEGQVEKLQQLLRPMMLRRLKEDVEKNLAPKEETIIEVEMTSIQKRYYRAILEKNFSFLTKGAGSTSNLPNLMNTMMELRKCCNHPFLINGGEEQIIKEFRAAERMSDETLISVHVNPLLHMKVLIQSAGKMVLLDKLLPKLKDGGHKILIFSQMIRCLDILEDYLIQNRYLFERIDGRVRGNMRQAAIDRFSKPDSDRFVFLLCTRAGGLGINLTAADTCIIFDSDWNPQNDIQAQARCHRIGQQKAVKVYRLITRNSYEREMFDKASMKLGLDKAVLQSMRDSTNKEAASYNPQQQALSKKEIEDLLRRGAYGAIMDDDDQSSQFCAEDIDMILQRRTQVIKHKPGQKGSSFAKASFTTDSDHTDIKIDDPDFWHKWAKRADIDPETGKDDFLIDVPRERRKTKRFGDMDEILDLTSDESEDEKPKPQATTTKKTKEKREPSQRPPKKQMPCGWTRLECFRVEKGLLTFGWGRWDDILATTRFKRRLGEKDVESIARTMLMYCLQHYKGDENIKSFIWDLVTPAPDGTVKDCRNHKGLSAPVPRGRKGKKPKRDSQAHMSYDITAKERNLDNLLTDQGYKNHLKRHCNKVLLRVRLLYYLKQEVIGDFAEQIENMVHANMLPLDVPAPEGEPPVGWWDREADHSLLIGVYKHGYEKYPGIRLDPCLCFRERCGVPDHREIMAAQAKENEDFNESQLDVEGGDGDGLDGDDGEGDDLGDIDEGKDEGMEIAASSIPKHLKEDPDDDSISPSSTRPSSPTSGKTVPKLKINSVIIPTAVPGKLLFPTAPDLNTRLRRLVAAYQREHKKRQLKEQKREKKEQVKMVRMQEQMRQRELRKIENAQKWSRREEADFYRILTAFGVDKDQETGKFRWERFKRLAKLDRKYEERMTEFYQHYFAMCLRVCKKAEEIPEGYASTPLPDNFTIEDITEERASKCLSRIDLLNKIRTQILPHPDLDERLTKCRQSLELPDWWELGRHDKDLIIGVCRYGINRQESQHAMMNDEELCFKELKEKFPEAAAAMPAPVATTTPGTSLGPFQRRPGLKKPGPKKGVPRKKKPPPGDPNKPPAVAGMEGTASQGSTLQEGEDGKANMDNGDLMQDAAQTADSPIKFGEGDDERTKEGEVEGMEETTNGGSSIGALDTPEGWMKEELESRPDSADMSQDANSINDDLDEGLGSGDDDNEDDDDKMDDTTQVAIKEENMDISYDSPDNTSKISGMDEETSNSFAVKTESIYDDYDSKDLLMKAEMKYENLSDDNSNMGDESKDQLSKMETRYENMSDDNSTMGEGEQQMDEKPHPLSMLQQVLLRGGGDDNHFGLVKQEGGEGSSSAKPAGKKPSSTKKKDGVPKVVVPTFRWPKDRVIVHRLEQLSHLVLKDEWPGRRHHHHPALTEPPYDDTDSPGPRGGLEHNYAGGMSSGRKRAAPVLNPDGTVKKKKKKKKLMLDAHRAAQFAALMRQNQAMMAAFTSGGALPGSTGDDPSAIAALANNTPPQSTSTLSIGLPPNAGPSSSYHIHDTVFKAVPDFVREGRGPAEGRVVGVLDLSGKGMAKKKKKKVKVHTLKVDGKLIKIKKPVDPSNPLKPMKKKKKKHKNKLGAGSGQSTEHTNSTAASESQESQDDVAMGAPATPSSSHSSTTPVKKRKRLKNPVRLDESAITGEEKVGMISRESGKRLAGKHCPSLGNLSDWLVKHPTYNVAMEWGNIVKTKGYLREELKHRVATSKSRHVLIKPALATSSPNIAPAPTKLTIGGLSGSKVGGQRPMGGIGFPASFAGVGMGKIASSTGVTVTSGLTASSPDGSKSSTPKKKKKKTSSSPIGVKKNILPRTITVDANAASQLAGISPFLLPNTGNVFFSPFLAQQGVLQAGGNTVTITSPGSAPQATQRRVVTPTLHVVSGAADKAARKRTLSEANSPIGSGQNNVQSSDSDSSDDDDGQLMIRENDDL